MVFFFIIPRHSVMIYFCIEEKKNFFFFKIENWKPFIGMVFWKREKEKWYITNIQTFDRTLKKKTKMLLLRKRVTKKKDNVDINPSIYLPRIRILYSLSFSFSFSSYNKNLEWKTPLERNMIENREKNKIIKYKSYSEWITVKSEKKKKIIKIKQNVDIYIYWSFIMNKRK